jgi:fucose permease
MRAQGSSKGLFALLFAGFAAYGVVMTVYGATVPRVISDFGWSYTTTGLVLAATSVGFFISTFVTGLLVEGSRPKMIYVGAACVGAAAVALFARWPSPLINLFISLIVGVAQGVIEVVTNYETVRLEKQGQSRLMNLLHAGFSAGAIAGPLGVAALMAGGGSWKLAFLGSALLLLALGMAASLTRFPAPERGAHHGTSGGLALLRQPLLLLMCVAIIFYIGSEAGATNWVSEYFVTVLGTPGPVAAFAVSALWIGMMAGRAMLSVLWRSGAQEKLLLALSLFCVAALLVFLALRGVLPALATVAALGLGYSGIYPVIMTLAGRAFRSSAAVGIVTTAAGIGSFSLPFLLAGISQGAGLRAGFLLLGVLPLGISIVSILLIRLRPRDDLRRENVPGA